MIALHVQSQPFAFRVAQQFQSHWPGRPAGPLPRGPPDPGGPGACGSNAVAICNGIAPGSRTPGVRGAPGQGAGRTTGPRARPPGQVFQVKRFNNLRYVAIFGDRSTEGDPATATQVLIDFCEQFPEGKCGATRKKRGDMMLAQYTHAKGKRVAKKTISSKYKLDHEAFIVRMRAARDWSAERAAAEWRRLDQPEQFADMKGPGGSKRLHFDVSGLPSGGV